MALTKEELTGSLQNEIRVLLHLISKIEPQMLDYRPTPKQRSTIELLRYLSIMGPNLVPAVKTGNFDGAKWGEALAAANAKDLDGITADIGKQADMYGSEVGGMTEAQLSEELDMFGRKHSRGFHLVNMVLGAHAAYRMQLFMYLKACGREELNTMNLWAGVDAPMQA